MPSEDSRHPNEVTGPPTVDGRYEGPPVNVPPPPGWRVESVALPGEPRRMPEQDHSSIDAEEQRAKLVAHWTALVAIMLMFAVIIVGIARL